MAKLEDDIMSNINNLRDEVIDIKDTVINRLLEENEKVRKKCSKLKSRLVTTESFLNQLEKYGRRNNIVISAITDDVSYDQLEEVFIKILKGVDVNVEASNIEACHRFCKSDRKSYSKRTIISFPKENTIRKHFSTKKRTEGSKSEKVYHLNVFMNKSQTITLLQVKSYS